LITKNKSLLHSFLFNQATGKNTLFFFILANVVYAYMLTISIPEVMAFANGMALPDMLPTGYSLSYLQALFNELGEKGMDIYLYKQLLADTFYPMFFGISYCLVWFFFLKKLKKYPVALNWIAYFPFLAGTFDYFENIGIYLMLKQHTSITQNLAVFTSSFTIIKSTFTTLYFVALIVLLLLLGYQLIKQGKLKKHRA
jgi:hypothetical protein